jgi:hypothetical protein
LPHQQAARRARSPRDFPARGFSLLCHRSQTAVPEPAQTIGLSPKFDGANGASGPFSRQKMPRHDPWFDSENRFGACRPGRTFYAPLAGKVHG